MARRKTARQIAASRRNIKKAQIASARARRGRQLALPAGKVRLALNVGHSVRKAKYAKSFAKMGAGILAYKLLTNDAIVMRRQAKLWGKNAGSIPQSYVKYKETRMYAVGPARPFNVKVSHDKGYKGFKV